MYRICHIYAAQSPKQAYNDQDACFIMLLQLQEAGVLLSEEELWYVLSEMAQVNKAVYDWVLCGNDPI